ncbi:hypothetical protein PM082_010719 [Marasmius tenuissimus]|nr:hypothetical protein PM082_010719 [Marasmius tenuissimus]
MFDKGKEKMKAGPMSAPPPMPNMVFRAPEVMGAVMRSLAPTAQHPADEEETIKILNMPKATQI